MSLWWGEIKFVDFRFPPLGFRPRRMGEREEKEGRGEEGEENFPWRNQKRFGIEMMELVGFEPTAFRMQSGRATTALKPLEEADTKQQSPLIVVVGTRWKSACRLSPDSFLPVPAA